MKYIFNLSLYLSLSFLIFSACSTPSNQEVENAKIEENTPEETVSKDLILFFGNSLTAGYGLDEEESFPGLVAARIDSLELAYRVINGGLSGETTASGLSRLDWFLEEKPAIFVLELGGNDGLRGISLTETKKNLKSIINLVKTRYPDTKILLAGMQIPPNMGQEYTREFQNMYPTIAEEENVKLIPFLLEGVAGDPDLNLPDGIHPTAEGHQIVFETIWPFIEAMLEG
ncbi:arylesterase [Belliella pelovolcani]|uniref:Acyl-CoA thioesterase-1 n=1 Tax=Belliella pelovolcani TaxID=529505 RepID=A0A1N7L446_9BACT|nr:arylesterase [Belliella pelovolcani]SIS68450.1 acyl-CoA thioesterase-1 [Belliella pelovolcani]